MIAVIILNWNNAPDTLECLKSVFASKKCHFKVYVADNGSKDDSVSIIQKAYPEAIIVENKKNLGFAEGNNRAISQALQDKAKYLFLLNNDAIIAKDTLAILREAAEIHLQAAALGPKIYFYDSPMTISHGGGDWDPQTCVFFNRYRDVDESPELSKEIEKCSYIIGCSLFVRASVLQTVGLMDPRFFLNWEEIDWCWRMQKAGYDCLYVPTAKAWHKVSRSFVGGKRGPMWTYFFYRNRLLWMKRHLPRSERHRLTKHIFWPEFKFLIGESFGKDGPVARAALKGIRDYFLHRFGPGAFRRILQ